MHWVRYLIPIWESINISVKSPPENTNACTPRWIHFVATFPEAKLAWPSYFAPLSCTHIHGFFVARCLRWLHAQMKGPLPPLSPTGKIFLEVEPNFRDILLAGYQIWLPLICMHIWEIQNILISAGVTRNPHLFRIASCGRRIFTFRQLFPLWIDGRGIKYLWLPSDAHLIWLK